MEKLSVRSFVALNGYENSTKILICVTAVMLSIIIFSLLLTRQIINFDNTLQTITFLLVVGVGYGLASWILLKYIKQTSTGFKGQIFIYKEDTLFGINSPTFPIKYSLICDLRQCNELL